MRHRAARGVDSTMGAEVRSRRVRVGRALRHGRPIAAEDMTLATEMAKDISARLRTAYIQGAAFLVMMATSIWSLTPWTRVGVLMLAAGLVSVVIYAVGIAYGLRVQRWLRRNS